MALPSPSSVARVFSQFNGSAVGGAVEITPSTIQFYRTAAAGNEFTGLSLPSDGTKFTIKLVGRNSDDYELFIDGVSVSTTPTRIGGGSTDITGANINLSRISNNADTAWHLYRLRFRESEGGTLLNDWNADSASSAGSGNILYDDVGGNNATQQGTWPGDDSEWVFYSAGGATYTLTIDAGSYTYTGSAINLSAGRVIAIDAGSYAYTGQPVALSANRFLSIEAGSYTYTGSNVTLTYTPAGGATYTLTIDPGGYIYTGQDVAIAANRSLAIDAGAYSYTGQDIALSAHRTLAIDAGSYAYAGQPVIVSAKRVLLIDPGSYAYTGFPVHLTYSGVVIALISGYSVNYQQDTISAGYADNGIKAEFI